MDIDEPIPAQSSTSNINSTTTAVDESFDPETYISNYSGSTAVQRLVHIIATCPPLAPAALHLAVQHIHQLRDVSLYAHAVSVYDQLTTNAELGLPQSTDVVALDPKWYNDTLALNNADRSKLEVELKTYTSNMIKESIRMGHRDLADYHRSVGDLPAAMKHYTKSREFCTTSQHVIDMCLSVIEVLIEQRNYSHIATYVFKADAALDAANASSAAAPPGGPSIGSSGAPTPTVTAGGPSSKKKSPEHEKVQAKLDFATALSYLGQGYFGKAATEFLKLGSATSLGDWVGKIVAPGDIAVYGTLCALANYSRSAIKSQVLENSNFGAYIEQEPYIRELITAYMSSDFKTTFGLLDRNHMRHIVDIHLAPHVQELTRQVRNCAVVMYFQPFAAIKLDRMSTAFGWTVQQVEDHVVALIQSGEIQGRVDSQNKILKARNTDYRAELFARAMKAGTQMQSANRKLLLRMRLQQAELVIKAPKGSSNNNQAHGNADFMIHD